jgi:hypothetical protein
MVHIRLLPLRVNVDIGSERRKEMVVAAMGGQANITHVYNATLLA